MRSSDHRETCQSFRSGLVFSILKTSQTRRDGWYTMGAFIFILCLHIFEAFSAQTLGRDIRRHSILGLMKKSKFD